MKPGDLVELKEGTFGLQRPDTYAIYLDRVKRKKQFFVVVYTGKGRKEVLAQHVKERAASSRIDGAADLSDAELGSRLRELVRQIGVARDAAPPAPKGEVTDRTVWEALGGSPDVVTPGTGARAVFGDNATRQHINTVRDALEACREPGAGYFSKAPERAEGWLPRSLADVKRARMESDAFRKLRNRLIRIREEEDENGRIQRIVEGVPIDQAPLDDGDRARLDVVARAMQDFVRHDRDRGAVTLPGCPIHTIDGFRLGTFVKFLAQDWVGASASSISGTFVRFLVDAKLSSVRDAIQLVAERLVLASEFFSFEYPADAVRESERFPRGIPAPDTAGRADFRALETYTIDPPDAKDYDDAISIVEPGDGRTLLHVHIADVSHYVRPGSALDHAARGRGTSVYLPVGVLPMLPPRLSDDLCSLRAGGDRLAVTASLGVAADGAIGDVTIAPSVIHVRANKAYGDVLDAIGRGEEPFASMHRLAQRMDAKRRSLSIETDEMKIHIEDDVVDPHLKAPTDATRMIETFMVAANEGVARFLKDHEAPQPYRCHPLPERHAVERFNRQLEVMGLPFKIELPEPPPEEAAEESGAGPDIMDALQKGGRLTLMSGGFETEDDAPGAHDAEETADDGAPATSGLPVLKGLAQLPPELQDAWLAPFEAILEHIAGIPDREFRELVNVKMLSTLGRALYTPDNLGHFGLGSVCYCHFTSPIRRYPDLVVHRQVKAVLAGVPLPHDIESMGNLTPLNTEQSVRAEKAERALVNVCLAFKARTGAYAGVHDAMVAGLTTGVVFLLLGGGIEARLPVADIPGGPYAVDESECMLFRGSIEDEALGVGEEGNWRDLYDPERGEMVKVRLRLGDRVRVRLTDFDLVEGRARATLAGSGDGSQAPR